MAISKYKFYAAIFLSSLLIVPLSFGQGISDALRVAEPGLGSNARALGMGNSFIGLSDDASAAYFNPAGFGLLKRLEFSGGLDYTSYNNSTTFFRKQTDYSNSSTRLNRISFAFPFPTVQGSLVFGISYHTSKDLTSALKFNGYNGGNTSMIQSLEVVRTNTDTSSYKSSLPYQLFLSDDLGRVNVINGHLNQSGTILASGALKNWTFSGAIEAYKNLFIGLNINIISGNYNSNNDYYEDDIQGYYANVETAPGYPNTKNFQTFYLNKILNWDISGYDFKAGFLYQFQNHARFGVTIQFPKTYSIKEDFRVSARSDFASETYSVPEQTDKVNYDIITPYELGAGFSVNFKGLIVSAQGTLLDYTQTKFDNPDGLSQSYIEQVNKNIKDQLKAVFNYNAGVEYTIPKVGIRIRGGYFIQASPYKGDPADFDKKYVTGGIGFLADGTIGLDLGFAHGFWSTYGDNYGVDVSRTYQDITVNTATLTATYRF